MSASGAAKTSLAYKIKEQVVKTSLLAFGVTFELVSKHSPELIEEIWNWEEGMVFSLGVMPDGPAVSLRKEGDQIRYLGRGLQNPQLTILFKNLDAAILPFTGQIGAHMAFVEHRAIVHGNLAAAMQVSRAMVIVQTYLMPGLILKRTFKRAPKLTLPQLLLKARIMASLGLGLALNFSK